MSPHCPAFVSPRARATSTAYSGRPASAPGATGAQGTASVRCSEDMLSGNRGLFRLFNGKWGHTRLRRDHREQDEPLPEDAPCSLTRRHHQSETRPCRRHRGGKPISLPVPTADFRGRSRDRIPAKRRSTECGGLPPGEPPFTKTTSCENRMGKTRAATGLSRQNELVSTA